MTIKGKPGSLYFTGIWCKMNELAPEAKKAFLRTVVSLLVVQRSFTNLTYGGIS